MPSCLIPYRLMQLSIFVMSLLYTYLLPRLSLVSPLSSSIVSCSMPSCFILPVVSCSSLLSDLTYICICFRAYRLVVSLSSSIYSTFSTSRYWAWFPAPPTVCLSKRPAPNSSISTSGAALGIRLSHESWHVHLRLAR